MNLYETVFREGPIETRCFVVGGNDTKVAEWKRTIIVRENPVSVYVPAATLGEQALLASIIDGVTYLQSGGFNYIPVDWVISYYSELKKEYAKREKAVFESIKVKYLKEYEESEEAECLKN